MKIFHLYSKYTRSTIPMRVGIPVHIRGIHIEYLFMYAYGLRSTPFSMTCATPRTHINSSFLFGPGMCLFSWILQNFSERQILWSLCLVVSHALTLNAFSTSLSVAPKLTVSLLSGEKVKFSGKQAHPCTKWESEYRTSENAIPV